MMGHRERTPSGDERDCTSQGWRTRISVRPGTWARIKAQLARRDRKAAKAGVREEAAS